MSEERFVENMTIREFFAALAMQAMVPGELLWDQTEDDVAKEAVAMADALLAALKGEE